MIGEWHMGRGPRAWEQRTAWWSWLPSWHGFGHRWLGLRGTFTMSHVGSPALFILSRVHADCHQLRHLGGNVSPDGASMGDPSQSVRLPLLSVRESGFELVILHSVAKQFINIYRN